MPVEIIDCEQNSPEWFAARAGIPTASNFATILAKGKGGAESLTRKKYMRKLAGEIITGQPSEPITNKHMDRGHILEPEARNLYAFQRDCEPEIVGFVRNGAVGCSPDSFIGSSGMLEIKTKLPELLIEEIELNRFPPEHVAQCQGQLWICEREWIDLMIYWPGLPPVIHRANRDDAYIANLAVEIDRFRDELNAIVDRVKKYGGA